MGMRDRGMRISMDNSKWMVITRQTEEEGLNWEGSPPGAG